MKERPAIATQMIDHLTLVVADLDKSARFYTENLDFTVVDRPPFALNGRWLQRGTFQIHLNESGKDAGEPGIHVKGAGSRSYAFHFAFRVSDIEKALRQAKDRGLNIIDGPRTRPDGIVQFYIEDPDGHLVELCSSP